MNAAEAVSPPARAGGKTDIRLALEALEVGESYLLPDEDLILVARQASTRIKKATGKTFTVRQLPDECRCWRTS